MVTLFLYLPFKHKSNLLKDATNSFDQVKFFQEHAEQVFQVVYETCMHQIEKIKRKTFIKSKPMLLC